MFRTSKLQKIVKVLQVQVIDEVAKLPRRMWRQVLMILMRQNETERMRSQPKGGADQFQTSPQEQDGQSRSADRNADKVRRFTMNNRAAEKVMPDVREARVRDFRARRLHQTCRPVDRCGHF